MNVRLSPNSSSLPGGHFLNKCLSYDYMKNGSKDRHSILYTHAPKLNSSAILVKADSFVAGRVTLGMAVSMAAALLGQPQHFCVGFLITPQSC